jgi:neutral ceramidase
MPMSLAPHRLAATVLVVALALTLLPAAAPAGAVPPIGTGPQRACARGAFCAGAASADITPPVTSPQFAYTFRHCAVATAAETASHANGLEDHLEEGQAWLLGGGPSCAASKAGPDTDLYAKTWPPSEGTYGRLLANAFVLDDGKGRRVAIVQADLGGIPGELHTAVGKKVAAAGVTRDTLMISATHTHGSVGGIWQSQGYALLGGDAYDPRVFEAVADGIATAVIEAAERLRPARLAVGFGTITNANGNRRTDQWRFNPEAKAGLDTPDAHRLSVIRIDTTDGVPLGAITNFTNHGVIHGTFNYFLSGDNQGQTTRQVARGIRAAAEAQGVEFPKDWEVVDTLLNGPAGDITPRSDHGGWTYEAYGYDAGVDNAPPFQQFARFENAGSRQTPEALRVWAELADDLTDDVTLDSRADFVCFCGQAVGDDPYDPYDRGEFVPANDDPNYFATSVEAILGNDDGAAAARTVFPSHHKQTPRIVGGPGTTPYTTRLQLVRINDLALVTMPGEPTIQMGRRIERSVLAAAGGLFEHAVVVGLANDYASYMATIQEFEAHRYEGSFSLFGQQTGNLLKERLVQLTELLRDGAPVAPCTRARACLEPVDTTQLAADPVALAPDALVGQVLTQPTDVERFVGTSFAWTGGSASAEWSPDDPVVELQRRQGKRWLRVTSDLDPELPLRYRKQHGTSRWTAYMDPTVDWPTGTYRFSLTGHATGPAGARNAYELTSAEFAVTPSGALTIARNEDDSFSVVHPAPDALANFRYRERVARTATVNGVHGATFTLAPGETLEVPAGGIVDAYGNTNREPVSVTG